MRIAVLICLLPSLGICQGGKPISEDSLKFRVLEQRIEKMEVKVESFRKQHQAGFWMTVGGVAIASAAALFPENQSTQSGFIILGGAVSIAGGIYMVDSYRYLRRTKK